NENLPWYQIKSDEVPPRFSEHLVFGDLVKVDAAGHCGQFRVDRTGELVDFTLIPQGAVVHSAGVAKPGRGKSQNIAESVRYLDNDAILADLPLGERYRFNLYQDEKGAFTRASLISDEFSYLVQNGLTYRIEAMNLDEGILQVARQIPEVKNYNGDMEQPPDIGRLELGVTPDTRVWKGSGQVKLADLAVGDELLINLTSEQPASRSHCTDIWVGVETHQLAIQEQH